MIKRIVRLNFQEGKVPEFLEIFNRNKNSIRNVQGCKYLELLRDQHQPSSLMTLSFWESEDDLNRYRESILFKETWTRVKALFADPPMAWSLNSLTQLK